MEGKREREARRNAGSRGEKGISSKESTERVVLTALFPRPPLPARIRQPCLSLCPPLLSVFPSLPLCRFLRPRLSPTQDRSVFSIILSFAWAVSLLSPSLSPDREFPFKRRVARPSDTFHRNCSTRRKVNNPLTTEGTTPRAGDNSFRGGVRGSSHLFRPVSLFSFPVFRFFLAFS